MIIPKPYPFRSNSSVNELDSEIDCYLHLITTHLVWSPFSCLVGTHGNQKNVKSQKKTIDYLIRTNNEKESGIYSITDWVYYFFERSNSPVLLS